MSDTWPVYFEENLIVGNKESSIGVATLWTPKEAIAKSLDMEKIAVVGQLYSNDGINPMMRNVLAYPRIKTILLCGADKIGSADALVKLIENGVNEKNQVIGKEEAVIEKEIPKEAIEQFRENIQVVDKRNVFKASEITAIVDALETDPEIWAEERIYPEAEISTERYPTDPVGFKFRGKTVAEVWLQTIHAIMKFGAEKQAHHSSGQRELINVMTVIEEEDPENPDFKPWLPFTPEHFEGYKPQVMTADKIPGMNYTYGIRLRDHDGKNQIETIIEKIKSEPFSRRAVAVTWNVEIDDTSEHPPCLDLVQALVQDDKLYLTCYLRSNDMFRAWGENALAFRTMQKEIADGAGIEMGSLCLISCSAHIYEESYVKANDIIEEYKDQIHLCKFDPRGNFTIELKEQMISVIQMDPTGRKIGKYQGKTAMDVYMQLFRDQVVTELPHAFDLGCELQKAELALKHQVDYTQDRPLEL